jgi:hypothetical protein
MNVHRYSLAIPVLFAGIVVAGSACEATRAGVFENTTSTGTGKGSTSSGTAGTGGANASSTGPGLGGGSFTTGGSGGATGSGPCTGLECQIHSCAGGVTTTISGSIYDPAGKNPLYGVVAYVPNTPPQALSAGASCYTCGDLHTGDPIAAAVTDADGTFVIKNAPDGSNIPLVIQVGKWRRQFVIPSVAMCKANPLPAGMLTLPKNHTEGDLPNIAVSTGGADTLECLLVRVGVDEAEYVGGAASPAGQRVHIFAGDEDMGGGKMGGGNNAAPNTSPPGPDPSTSLWDSATDINQFDIVILSCEGHETDNMNQQVMFNYAAAGGRVFGSHFHYAWFNTGPFGAENLATWTTGDGQAGNSLNADVVTTLPNGMTFPKGVAFQQWLGNVGALSGGELPIQAPRHNADVGAANTSSQNWLIADNNSQIPGASQDFSFDTPFGVPAAQQCGRVVYSDMHVGAASGDYGNGGGQKITPTGCATGDLSPQEKALEFILFDLSSCVTPNNMGGGGVPDAGMAM